MMTRNAAPTTTTLIAFQNYEMQILSKYGKILRDTFPCPPCAGKGREHLEGVESGVSGPVEFW